VTAQSIPPPPPLADSFADKALNTMRSARENGLDHEDEMVWGLASVTYALLAIREELKAIREQAMP
jgi:hypothetical protein